MTQSPHPPKCPQCDAELPANSPPGCCPKCLLAAVAAPFDSTTVGARASGWLAPSLQEVAAAFPHWEILELLGQGGMGAVYKVRQPRLDRLVALKVLPVAVGEVPGFPERFNREARLLARLSHPGIVSVHEFGQEGPFCYLLMEFVDGVNLRQAMRAGRFSPLQALGVVQRICEALQYAHGEGVLHRDIKPENILLDAKGRVKLADFGIGKLAADSEQSAAGLTAAGATLGTPQYMAPEQIEHPQDVDHRADIYSLGVVFYELLTGELPLGRFAPPSEKVPLSPGVDRVVLKALEKERERRHQNAGQLQTEVANIASGGGRPTLSIRADAGGRPSVRHHWALGFFLTAVVLWALVLGVAKWQQMEGIKRIWEMNDAQMEWMETRQQTDALRRDYDQAQTQKKSGIELDAIRARLAAGEQATAMAEEAANAARQAYRKLNSPPVWWFIVFGAAALMGLASSIIAWSALIELRRRNQEAGRFVALFVALLIPLGLLDTGIMLLLLGMWKELLWENRELARIACLGLAGLACIVTDVWLVLLTWRWLIRETALPPRRYGLLIAIAVAALALVGILVMNLNNEKRHPYPVTSAAAPVAGPSPLMAAVNPDGQTRPAIRPL